MKKRKSSDGEAQADPLERTEHRRRHRAGLGRLGLGEGHLRRGDRVAARRLVDAGGRGDRLLAASRSRGRDRLVDHQGDVELVDRARGRPSVLVIFLLTPKLCRSSCCCSCRCPTRCRAAVGVRRDVGARAGRADRSCAEPPSIFSVSLGLRQRHALGGVGELLGVVDLSTLRSALTLTLRLVRAQRRGEHRVDRGLELTRVARLGALLARAARPSRWRRRTATGSRRWSR